MRVLFITGALLAMSLCPLPACGDSPSQQIARIGVITDLSGPGVHIGTQTARGAQIAARELNAKDKVLKLVIEDSQLSAPQAVTAAQKLVALDKVEALFVDFTPTAAAVAPMAAERRLVMIYSALVHSVEKENLTAYKAFLDGAAVCRVIAEQWKKSGVKRIGVMRTTLEFGQACEDGARTVYPEIQSEAHDRGSEVKTQMLRFKSAGAEAILNMAYEGDLINMFKAAEQLHYKASYGVVGGNLTQAARMQFPEVLPRVYAAALRPSEQFIALFKREFPEAPLAGVEHAALSYAHIKQLTAVLLACKAGDLACQEQRLQSMPPDSAVHFLSWGGRAASYEIAIQKQ